ncbi:MAG: endonuclease III domain-containing protein [Bacilli bacterium]
MSEQATTREHAVSEQATTREYAMNEQVTTTAAQAAHATGPRKPAQRRSNGQAEGLMTAHLLDIYERLFAHYGDRRWWPADTPEEVIIGAILVQNVAWKNVETAIARLREKGWLSLCALRETAIEEVEECIVSTLYYRMKARKLQAFAAMVETEFAGDVGLMLALPADELRARLLAVWGVGPETADDIILYAANQPSFVIDTYTRRIFSRLGLTDDKATYDELRAFFMRHLAPDVALYNQYHALIDALGHSLCLNRRPRCGECPLRTLCKSAKAQEAAACPK